MGNKTFAFMRTHIITKGIINEYEKLSNSGIDTILFIDNKDDSIKSNGVSVLNM